MYPFPCVLRMIYTHAPLPLCPYGALGKGYYDPLEKKAAENLLRTLRDTISSLRSKEGIRALVFARNIFSLLGFTYSNLG